MIAEDTGDFGAKLRGLFLACEYIERRRRPIAARALLAADQYVEAVHLPAVQLAKRRHQGDVLRLGVTAVLQATSDGDVELAREICELAIVDNKVREGIDHRGGIKELVGSQA